MGFIFLVDHADEPCDFFRFFGVVLTGLEAGIFREISREFGASRDRAK